MTNDKRIALAHGEGARLTRRLIEQHLLPELHNPYLAALGDAAALPALSGPFAMTTDSFVVSPLFFPGGDIGTLAVYGTVNDLAVAGAVPRWLSLSLIIEEGLPLAVLDAVLQSVSRAARRVGVAVVTGDTKVVPRGAADGLFLNTSGVGELAQPVPPGPASLQPGDALLVSGPIGRHGVAVMAAREGLAVEPPPQSDCGPLVEAIERLRQRGVPLRALRDATRGGVAAVLQEWSRASGCTLSIDEQAVPVSPEVRGVAELLGLDPLHIANEGTMVLAVPQPQARTALETLHSLAAMAGAAQIGQVRSRASAPVTIRRALGSEQPLDEPLGAPLPRIC